MASRSGCGFVIVPNRAGSLSCSGGGGSSVLEADWDGERNMLYSKTGFIPGTGRPFVSYAYDYRRDVVKTRDALGNVTTMTWRNVDTATRYISLLESKKDQKGFTTRYQYDSKGNVIKVTDPLGYYTQTSYVTGGLVNKTVDRRGYTTWYEYDSHGWLKKSKDLLGGTTTYTYDALGYMNSTTTPSGLVHRKSYNSRGWLTSETDPLNHVTSYVYNSRGQVIAIVDANNNRTEYDYNVTNGKVDSVTDASGAVIRYKYDLIGNNIEIRDSLNSVWTYAYSSDSCLTQERDPLGHYTNYTCSAAGVHTKKTDAAGNSIWYYYDLMKRVVRIWYEGDDVNVTYEYDERGQVIREESYGFVRLWNYTSRGEVKDMTFSFGPFSKRIEYTYDANGNRETMRYPEGESVTYGYDALNRMTTVTRSGTTWQYQYDDDSRRTAILYPNAVRTDHVYDDTSRLISLETYKPGPPKVVYERFNYTYDDVGNRKTMLLENGIQTSYDYDEVYRLNQTDTENYTFDYVYTAGGSRLYRNESEGGRRWEYDHSLSRILEYWGSELRFWTFFTYDGNGNLVRKNFTWPGREETTYTYDYDQENRLLHYHRFDSGIPADSYTYGYFADGSRIYRHDSTGTRYYLYDFAGTGGLNDIVAEYTTSGSLIRKYVHGAGVDEPLALIVGSTTYNYHYDGLGSITNITNPSGLRVRNYSYEDFGTISYQSGSLDNPYTFTGREYDPGTGLYFYRARYYDSDLGMFLTRDPEGGTNRYAYAGQNPTSNVDPSGMRALSGESRWGPTGGCTMSAYKPPRKCTDWGKVVAGATVIAACVSLEVVAMVAAAGAGVLVEALLTLFFHSSFTGAVLLCVLIVGMPLIQQGLDSTC